jgi:uncharacterized protein (TIGR04255 family)
MIEAKSHPQLKSKIYAMKIEESERIVYAHNPLAEVVCQVRYEPVQETAATGVDEFRADFAAHGYSNHSTEVSVQFSHAFNLDGTTPQSPTVTPQGIIHHFQSEDGIWRISFGPEFLALTCLKYQSWDEFLPRLLLAIKTLQDPLSMAKPIRLGLRYKDVIEREPLGLNGAAWHELIQPFLLGPMMPDALAAGQTVPEQDVGHLLSQSLLRLEGCMLVLQSSLLTAQDEQRRAFLIDMDFFNEGTLNPDVLRAPEQLGAQLEGLHTYAGALFRRCITERLHHALRPAA